MEQHEPKAKVEFDISGNLYDIIFQTDKPDLEIHLQREEGGRPSVAEAKRWVDSLRCRFPSVEIPPVATEENLQYTADPERLAYYHVTYQQVYGRLKELVGSSKVYEIANGAQSVPVIISQQSTLNNQLSANDVMQQVVVNNEGVEIPLSYLMETHRVENFKRLRGRRGILSHHDRKGDRCGGGGDGGVLSSTVKRRIAQCTGWSTVNRWQGAMLVSG